MSKEKNKEKESSVHQKAFFFPEVVEKEARDNLAKKKFRQAKEGFKELYKLDKEKYLPELLQCYYGMADQMIQTGQLSDAAQVIDNIKTLTGDKNEGSLDILIALKRKDYHTVARIYTGLLSQRKDISDIQESPLVADALVIAFQEFPQLKSAGPVLYEELRAVQQALEDISAERYEEAWLKVKKIGMHSIFSHWKLLVKGLVAFYKEEDQKALEAFERISSDSSALLQGAAQPYMAFLEGNPIDRDTISEPLVRKMCIVAGYPDLASVLPKADYLWKTGQHFDSYCHVRNAIKSFPSESPDTAGMLTRFYFNSIHHLPEKAAMRYLEGLLGSDTASSPEYSLEKVLICRAEGLFFENRLVDDEDEDNDCAQIWECFLEAYTKVFGNNDKLKSLVYFHLGSMFAMEVPQEPPLFSWLSSSKKESSLRNARLAEHYFNEGIKADKDNKDAYLGLLKVYENTNNQAKVNKLLDRMVPLFPDDSGILTQAGVSCVERKSYIKGIKYLEQAVRLDPLDSVIKNHFVFACLKAAYAYFDKGQTSQGREIFEKALKNGISNPRDLNRAYAYIYARWAALELKNNNEDAACEKLQLARENVKTLLPLLYFTQLISRYYKVPDVHIQKLNAEVDREWRLPPTPENAVMLTTVYRYINTLGLSWLKPEMKKIAQYAFGALDKPCPRDDAISIVIFALSDKQTYKLGDAYIKKMLQKDKDDPQFSYLKYQLRIRSSSHPPGRGDIDELNRVLQLAEKRNSLDLARDVRKNIKALEELLKVENMLNHSDIFGDQDINMEILGKLFEEMHKTMGGQGRRKH